MLNGPVPDGMQVDHIDGNKWNNSPTNLRLATPSQNARNQKGKRSSHSGIKGAFWCKTNRVWMSYIQTDGGRVYLGQFQTKGCAAVAYAKAAMRYHGAYARIS